MSNRLRYSISPAIENFHRVLELVLEQLEQLREYVVATHLHTGSNWVLVRGSQCGGHASSMDLPGNGDVSVLGCRARARNIGTSSARWLAGVLAQVGAVWGSAAMD